MAYLNVAEMHSGPSARAQTATARIEPSFSALEWTVVALAKRERLASLKEPGRLSRALGTVFGGGTGTRLADPRLETLRRVAVYAWRRGYALPAREVSDFLRAGFTMAQAELLLASITGGTSGQLAWRIAA